MFNSQGSQMDIRDQISNGFSMEQHFLKHSPVPVGGMDKSCTGLD
jgi:hypothetical protein